MVNFRYFITACERSRQESFGCWACCTILLSSEETAARLRAGSLAKSTGPSSHGWLRTCHYRRVLVRDAKLRRDRSQNNRFDLKKSIDDPLPVRKNRSQNRQTTSNAANLVLGPRKDRSQSVFNQSDCNQRAFASAVLINSAICRWIFFQLGNGIDAIPLSPISDVELRLRSISFPSTDFLSC